MDSKNNINRKQTDHKRLRDLAKIHIAAKQLGMNEITYRDMLYEIAGVRSAGNLSEQGRVLVINHLKSLGFKPTFKKKTGYKSYHKSARKSGMHIPSSEDRSPLLSKIGALLADLDLHWAYADGISKRMFGVDRVRWLYPDQLHKVAVALIYLQKRKKEPNRE